MLASLVLALSAASLSQAQEHRPYGRISQTIEQGIPIAGLPEHVPAAPGELALYADYAAAAGASIPLYVINRTDQDVAFANQDWSIYLMLEHQDEDGMWARAQPHVPSTCGNSYFGSRVLPPERFWKTTGWFPSRGEPAKVRFSSWGGHELVSNSGEGHVDPGAILAASRDYMAIARAPRARLRTLAADDSVSLSTRFLALNTLASRGAYERKRREGGAGPLPWFSQNGPRAEAWEPEDTALCRAFLADESSPLRHPAASALDAVRELRAEELHRLALASAPSARVITVQLFITRALRGEDDEIAFEVVDAWTREPDASIRSRVAMHLEHLVSDTAAARALALRLSTDPEEHVRRQARETLARLGVELPAEPPREPVIPKTLSAEALRAVARDQALPLAERVAAVRDLRLRSSRPQYAQQVGMQVDAATLAADRSLLVALLDARHPELRIEAAHYLVETHSPTEVEIKRLCAALDATVRRLGIRGARELVQRGEATPLSAAEAWRLVRDLDEQVRVSAAGAAGRLFAVPELVEEALIELEGDPEPHVRTTASETRHRLAPDFELEVVDADGLPVEGASVRVASVRLGSSNEFAARVAYAAHLRAGGALAEALASEPVGRTDLLGKVRIPKQPGGRLRVVATKGNELGTTEYLGRTAGPQQLELAPRQQVDVYIQDAGRRPVEGVPVALRSARGSKQFYNSWTQETDGDGAVRFDPVVELLEPCVSLAIPLRALAEVRVQPKSHRSSIRLRLPPTASLELEILDEEGVRLEVPCKVLVGAPIDAYDQNSGLVRQISGLVERVAEEGLVQIEYVGLGFEPFVRVTTADGRSGKADLPALETAGTTVRRTITVSSR